MTPQLRKRRLLKLAERMDQLRAVMHRRCEQVDTPYGPIAVKVGQRGGVVTATPEYEPCRKAALHHGVALREVMAAAQFAWQARAGQR